VFTHSISEILAILGVSERAVARVVNSEKRHFGSMFVEVVDEKKDIPPSL
jgi:hypothetical protein